MINLSEIEKNCIIICPSERKEQLIPLFNRNIEYNVKYLSKEEIINSLTFTYDNNAILYLQDKGYSFDNALEILNNLNFVEKGTPKLDLLVDLKEELVKMKKLKYRSNFKDLFTDKKVYVYGYSSFDKEVKKCLDEINVEYKFINEDNKGYLHDVNVFKTIEEEVLYFFNSVCKLIESGVNINDILLYKYPSEYELILRKYAKNFNMPINFSSNMKLIESPLFKEFISLTDSLSFQEAINIVNEKEDKFNVVSKLINIVNEVMNLKLSKENQVKYLYNLAKSIKLHETPYKNAIEIVTSLYRGDKYVFVLGFSLGSYPVVKKDTDLLSDKEKEICGINTSIIENKINYEKLKGFLNNNKNVIISLKEKVGKVVYYDSLLINELKYKKLYPELDNIRYSKKLGELEVASYNDLKSDYGIDNRFLLGIDPLSFRYKKYSHAFKPSNLFNNDGLLELSYTKMDEYNKCPFQYFIKRVCNANAFEPDFKMKLGSLYHKVLEDSLKKDVTRDDYLDEINKEFKTPQELFFVDKLFDQIFNVINKNRAFKLISSFNLDYGEQNMFYYYDKKTIINGIIDKIIVNEEDKEIIIVDYKTGDTEFVKEYVPIGQSLQLPIYSLLVDKNYPEYSQVGIYIQNVISKSDNVDKIYKLSGISVDEGSNLEHIEHALSNYSKYVKGLSKFSTGYKKTKNIVSKDEFDEVIKQAKEVIKNTISNIRKGEFNISPLYINKENKACKNCPLKAICFKDDEDNRYIEIEKEEEE